MKYAEAIETIKIAVAEVEWNYPLDYAIAFETAVNALEKQQKIISLLDNFCETTKDLTETEYYILLSKIKECCYENNQTVL